MHGINFSAVLIGNSVPKFYSLVISIHACLCYTLHTLLYSTPITACWYQMEVQTKNSDDSGPVPPKPPKIDPLPPPMPQSKNRSLTLEDCVILNSSNSTILKEYRTFNVVGTFMFVARFYNRVSETKTNLTIHVVPGEVSSCDKL